MKGIGIFFIFIFLFFPVRAATTGISDEIAVVVNPLFPSNTLNLLELKEIYLGHKKFINGVRLHPYHQQGDRLIKNLFIEDALGISQISYMSFWHVKSFRDGSSPPRSFQTSEELVNEIQSHAGALGYIWAQEANGTDGIRVLMTLPVSLNRR